MSIRIHLNLKCIGYNMTIHPSITGVFIGSAQQRTLRTLFSTFPSWKEMLGVKCSEKSLYLDVFVGIFLHLLPSWEVRSHWWLTQIYSSPLLAASSSAAQRFPQTRCCPWVMSLAADVPVCHVSAPARPLFTTSSITPLRTSPCPPSFLLLFPLICYLRCRFRNMGWVSGWPAKWIFEAL